MIVKSINDVSKEEIDVFSCGNNELDYFLKKYALINDKNGYGKTFLLKDDGELVGFFTICSSSIKFEEYPNYENAIIPKYPIPCIRIARLAVKSSKQGKGYGKELLKQALLRILNVADTIGVKLIVVDAKKTSTKFYEKYGFIKLKSDSLSYYLLIDTIKLALANEK